MIRLGSSSLSKLVGPTKASVDKKSRGPAAVGAACPAIGSHDLLPLVILWERFLGRNGIPRISPQVNGSKSME